MADLLPPHTTPEDLAEHIGVPVRTVKERARAIGACRILGKRMIMLAGDVQLLLEDMRPCPSKSSAEAKSGTTAATPPAVDYEALRARRTASSPSASPQKPKPALGVITSTVRERT